MAAINPLIQDCDDPAEALAHQAQILSRAIQPAWRYANQKRNAQAHIVPIVPLEAPVKLADVLLNPIWRMIAAFGVGEFTRAIEAARRKYGEIGDWIDLEQDCHPIQDWDTILDEVSKAVSLLSERDQGRIKAELLTFDWQQTSHALVMASFAAHGILALSTEMARGHLPYGVMLCQHVLPGIAHRVVDVVDPYSNVLGRHDQTPGAVQAACRSQLAQREPGSLTFEEFQSVTKISCVTAGRGKTEAIRRKRERRLTDTTQDLDHIREMLGLAYDAEVRRGMALIERKDWIDQGMQHVLNESFPTRLNSHWLPGAGHLLLVRDAKGVSQASLCAIHNRYVEERRQNLERESNARTIAPVRQLQRMA